VEAIGLKENKTRILKGEFAMTVYVLSVDGEIIGIYDEYTKAYDIGCSKYDGNFDIEEFDVE
jgi:hypothetical protein